MSVCFLDSPCTCYWDEKVENGSGEQFLHVIMIQRIENIFFQHLSNVQIIKKKLAIISQIGQNISFRGRGFHTPVVWKIGYELATSFSISMVNTAFACMAISD